MQEQLKVLLKEDTFNPFLTYACFYCFYHVSSTFTQVFRNHMSKLKKNDRNYLFYCKTLFFISKWKDQFAKRYWCCEVWRSEQGKTIYTSDHISKKCRLLYILKKVLLRLVSFFVCLLVFFLLLCFYEKGFGWFWPIHLHYFN